MESQESESLQEAYKKLQSKTENERPQTSSASPSPPPTPSLKADQETFEQMPQLHRTSSQSLPSPTSPVSPSIPELSKFSGVNGLGISGASKKSKRPGTKRRSSSGTSIKTLKQDLLYDDSEEMASDPDIQQYAETCDGLQWGMGTLANERKWPAFPKAKKADLAENQQKKMEEVKKPEFEEEEKIEKDEGRLEREE